MAEAERPGPFSDDPHLQYPGTRLRDIADTYDRLACKTSTTYSGSAASDDDDDDGGGDEHQPPMDADPRNDMPNARTGGQQRRRTRSAAAPPRPSIHPQQPRAGQSPQPQNPLPGSSRAQAAYSAYPPRAGFGGQPYTMSTPLAHTPPPYPFAHFHPADVGMLGYAQPPFPYPAAAVEPHSPAHHSNPPMYPPPSPAAAAAPGPPFQYPPSLSMPAFRYPSAAYPFPPPYPSPAFAQHYTPAAETEPQVAWYYFSHLAAPPHAAAYHQGHYTIGYPHGGHAGVDSPGLYPARPFAPPTPPEAASTPSASPSAHQPQPQPQPQPPTPSDKPPQRRSYHPNPSAHRSEWVMWAGNVPSGATHDELWRFFTVSLHDDQPAEDTNGVLSIFLISRSSCAFVNYTSEEHLQQAIARFDGVSLRPNDLRCPRLVCRVRGKGDDLKAGVGYQRGMGMHTTWLREQKGKAKEMSESPEVFTSDGQPSSPGSLSDSLARAMSAVSISSDDDTKRIPATHSSSSGSYASTTSTFLSKHFPKRYFILKSLTQEDLDLSVERGLWATQKHNEEILDQAFRTSQEVYLIFGVNKSREFYGYARMTSSVIRDGQQGVQWAARPPIHPNVVSRPSASPLQTPSSPFFSPSEHRLVDLSPAPVYGSSPSMTQFPPGRTAGPSNLRHSAPPLLGEGYHKLTLESPRARQISLNQSYPIRNQSRVTQFELDGEAPGRAMRVHQGLADGVQQDGSGSVSSGPSRTPASLRAVVEEEPDAQGAGDEWDQSSRAVVQPPEDVQRGEVSWGDSFAVEWLCTTKLPFSLTRHLRNPWNRGKEIKVSRDGTEVEPSVGEQLLREWPNS